MLEISGNIWDFQSPRTPIVITTNGFVKANGQCVMGRGVAYQAKQRYPKLPMELGQRLQEFGNRVFYFPDYNIITFPTKHVWWEQSDIDLIRTSAIQLEDMTSTDYINTADNYRWTKVYLVRPGCANGGLTWEVVKPVIKDILTNDNFVVVQN